MASFDRRDFSGNAVPTVTTGSIDNDDLTINISDATGWPDGDVGSFVVTIDKDLATEEKIEVGSRTDLVLTTVAGGRGHDNTAAVSHAAGAPIEHTMAARDLQEANQHIADTSLDHHTQYLNSARHTATQHSIDYDELVPGQRWEPGDFKWSMQAGDHAGWLKMDGRNNLSRAEYDDLFAVVGENLGAGMDGTTFGIGDVSKRVVMGKAASGVGSTLGGVGGSANAVVVTHSHQINNHTHAGTTSGESVDHSHSMQGHVHALNHAHSLTGGKHSHQTPGGDYGFRNAVSFSGANEGLMDNYDGPGITFSEVVFEDILSPGEGGATALAVVSQNGNSQGPNTGSTAGRSAEHTHTMTTDNPSDRGTDNGSGAVAGTDKNLQPFLVMNGFIHT